MILRLCKAEERKDPAGQCPTEFVCCACEGSKRAEHLPGAPLDVQPCVAQQVPNQTWNILQVHKAWLTDGTPVAVKVQYPGLAGKVMADLAGMVALARAASWLFPDVSLVWLFEELQRYGG